MIIVSNFKLITTGDKLNYISITLKIYNKEAECVVRKNIIMKKY